MPLSQPRRGGPTTFRTPAYAMGTTYRNETGRPLWVSVTARCKSNAAGDEAHINAYSESATPPWQLLAHAGVKEGEAAGDDIYGCITFLVLPDDYYKVMSGVTASGAVILVDWVEWF